MIRKEERHRENFVEKKEVELLWSETFFRWKRRPRGEKERGEKGSSSSV